MLLTDRSQLSLGRGLVTTVRECVGAGLSWVVVREHDLEPVARAAVVRRLAEIEGLTVISSRVVDPAAAGVHLAAGQPVPDLAPVGWGRSCHTADEVRAAAEEGATWVTLSPYAASASKPGYGPALPASEYAEAATVGVPVYALGGVTPDNAAAALRAGAHGVAVMGEVMRSHEPAAVVAALLAVLGEIEPRAGEAPS